MLRVEHLSKIYQKTSQTADTFREEITFGFKRLFGKLKSAEPTEFYALKDISFELKKGEVLGIIGRNGSGKTTLLKILSRITAPTSGQVVMDGRSTSILNIGTGFHLDLSGRDNISLNGELLGMSRQQIKDNFDSIVAYSGVGDFLDTPVKHYSDGMYLRLAFAIAFHAPLELLFLDEVMSVGDAEFRIKSLNHIEELVHNGTSVVMISHNLNEISHLCDRVLWLDKGVMRAMGPAMEVLEQYIGETYEKMDTLQTADSFPGNDKYQLEGVSIHAVGKAEGEPIYCSDGTQLTFKVRKFHSDKSLELGMTLYDMSGIRVLTESYFFRQDYTPVPLDKGLYLIRCTIPKNLLHRGYYRLNLTVTEGGDNHMDTHQNLATFQLQLDPEDKHAEVKSRMNAILLPQFDWEIKKV